MKRLIVITLIFMLLLCSCAKRPGVAPAQTDALSAAPTAGTTAQTTAPAGENEEEVKGKRMKMQIGENVFTIQLEQNETAAALAVRLPLTLQMRELHGNEKYNYLPFSLPTNEAAVGQIRTGDVMLFGDNCLVVFYQDFSTSYSYTKIGTVEDTAGLTEALGTGDVQVLFHKE